MIFKNILFVLQGPEVPDNAIKHAAKLVKSSPQTSLTFLSITPIITDDLQKLLQAYKQNVEDTLKKKLNDLEIENKTEVIFKQSDHPFITVIQEVLTKNFDLVVKSAEALDKKQASGFKSTDMSLLRKCPCPVWLYRDFSNTSQPKVLTAIDPFSDEQAGYDLNFKLLEMGEEVARAIGGQNKVISCWEFEYEGFLRHSPFAKMPEDQIDELLKDAEVKHTDAVRKILSKADISFDNTKCLRGRASDIIPNYVDEENIDIIVMGTVARTGIPGFLIGNTAENIVQSLSCGMIAAKPNGFASPIKPY